MLPVIQPVALDPGRKGELRQVHVGDLHVSRAARKIERLAGIWEARGGPSAVAPSKKVTVPVAPAGRPAVSVSDWLATMGLADEEREMGVDWQTTKGSACDVAGK